MNYYGFNKSWVLSEKQSGTFNYKAFILQMPAWIVIPFGNLSAVLKVVDKSRRQKNLASLTLRNPGNRRKYFEIIDCWWAISTVMAMLWQDFPIGTPLLAPGLN